MKFGVARRGMARRGGAGLGLAGQRKVPPLFGNGQRRIEK